ncbi:hypothetical protein L873DRAFT_1700991 [Choiromyces venosus 120613-1]|uniref:PIN domain-containing protein n=1 Tax=Choiromyces venosus 120613-1 TaxID=1336337 RepID=A0A3N4JBA7_9PEZI|nr:hypothetical protein L873DRAFT_1700991 [Choiromyces venosus 120613-1]
MASDGNESEDDGYELAGQSEEEPKQVVAKGPKSLKENFTICFTNPIVLVVDTNILLSQPEIFKLMVSTFNWSIVIPNTVITELLGLRNSTGPVGDSTKAAMIAIHEALTDKRDVKVVTAKGSNVTNIGFYKEQPDKPGDDEQRKMDDIIIETTKLQGEAWRQATLGDYGDYEAAI